MDRTAGMRPVSARRWPPAARPGGAFGIQPGEADRPAHVVRHAAALAVVMQRDGAVILVFVDLDVGVVAGERGAPVGCAAAGLGDERARDGGTPKRLAGPGHDGPAFRQRLPRRTVSRRRWRSRRRDGRGRPRHAARRSCRPAAAPSARSRRRCGRSPRRRSRSAPRGRCRRRRRRRARREGNPASTSTPALKANSMSPTADGRSRPRPPRKESAARVALSVSAKRPRSMDCAAAGSGGGSTANPRPATASSRTSQRRPERAGEPRLPEARAPAAVRGFSQFFQLRPGERRPRPEGL